MCSDFAIVVGKDGNIYYADTRHSSAKIMRRTLAGKETVLASNKIFEFISGLLLVLIAQFILPSPIILRPTPSERLQ